VRPAGRVANIGVHGHPATSRPSGSRTSPSRPGWSTHIRRQGSSSWFPRDASTHSRSAPTISRATRSSSRTLCSRMPPRRTH
jgi:hypothetical protein